MMSELLALPKSSLQFKSSECVLAPVINQISYLFLVFGEHKTSKHSTLRLKNVKQQATALMDAVNTLINTALQLKHLSTKESTAKIEIACNQLELSARNTVLASQNFVTIDSSSHVIFAHNLKNLVENMYKVFLAIEDVENDRILRVLSWIKELLRSMNQIESLDELVKGFKQYTEGLLILFNLIAKQQRDLRSEKKKHVLGTAALVVKKVAPSVNKCCQTCLKYPRNSQAKESKLAVFTQIYGALDEITAAIQNKNWMERNVGGLEDGLFINIIDQILSYVKSKPKELDDGDFEYLVEKAVRHSLSVASMSVSKSNKRECIVHSCIKILKLGSKVVFLSKSSRRHTELQQVREDLREDCETVVTEIHDLERNVNSLLMEVMVDVFKESTEPLDRLVKAAMSKRKILSTARSSVIQPFYEEFCEHLEQMLQVAAFVASSSSNSTCVDKVKATIAVLEKINPEILPSIMECNGAPDTVAIDHLRHLHGRFNREVGHLSDIIDDITDALVFTNITGIIFEKNISKLEQILKEGRFDTPTLVGLVRAETGLCEHLIRVLTHQAGDNSPDVQNKLTKACSNLTQVIAGVKKAAGRVSIDQTEQVAQGALLKRLGSLGKCIQLVKSILNEGSTDDDTDKEVLDIENTDDLDDLEMSAAGEKEEISEGANMWLSLLPLTSKFSVPDIMDSGDLLTNSVGLPSSCEVDVELSALIKQLIDAVAVCDETEVELICSRLMQSANDVVSICSTVIPTVEEQETKQMMRDLVSLICTQTIEFPSLATQSIHSDVSSVDRLQHLLEKWSRNVQILEELCDAELSLYLQPCSQLKTGVQLANIHIVNAAKKEFQAISCQFDELLTFQGEEACSELFVAENFRLKNQQYSTDISNKDMTATIRGIASLSRRWACNILSATSVISEAATELMAANSNIYQMSSADCVIVTEQTFTYMSKVLIAQVCTESEKAKLIGSLDKIQQLVGQMCDASPIITQCLEGVNTAAIFLRWAVQVSSYMKLVDVLLEPYSTNVSQLLFGAVSVHRESGTEQLSKYEKLKQGLTADLDALVGTFTTITTGGPDTTSTSMLPEAHPVQKVLKSFQILVSISDRLTQAATTDELLTSFKWHLRLFVVHLLSLKLVTLSSAGEVIWKKLLTFSGRPQAPVDTTATGLQRNSGDSFVRSGVDTLGGHTSANRSASKMDIESQKEHYGSPKRLSTMFKSTDTPFTQAVRRFHGDLEKWMDNSNVVVKAAQSLAECLQDMSLFAKYSEGPIRNRKQLFDQSQQVVKHSQTITRFCNVIAKYSLAGTRLSDELLYHSNQITFYAKQLSMLTNVKRCTNEFDTTVNALATNGDNLMRTILQSLKSSESILLKGLKEPSVDNAEEQEIYLLATRWRGGLLKHRHNEAHYSEINDLGLRVVSKNSVGPRLTEICNLRK